MLHSHQIIFSTSDRTFYQMCYCCRKLEISVFSVYFWEAMWGCERPCEAVLLSFGLEICVRESQIYLSQWEEHGLTRPLTASHFRPLTASHHLSLTEFLMWPVWANQGSTASHTHGLSDLWGRGSPRCRSASHATKSCDLSESPKWEAVWEADWPLTHTGPVAPLPAEAMHLAVKSVRQARGSYSLGR